MDNDKNEKVLDLDESFQTGGIVDGTGVDLDEVNRIMKEYFRE